MGRWRRPALVGVLPIHGEVAAKPPERLDRFDWCPPHSWGGGGGPLWLVSSPFMGRWRRSRRSGSTALIGVLPIHGEVAAARFGWCPPHSWGGGGEAAGGAGPLWLVSSPFMGRWRRSRRRGWPGIPGVLPIHGEVAAKPPEGLARYGWVP